MSERSYSAGMTALDILNDLIPPGHWEMETVWVDPDAETLAAYRSALRDYVSRRRNGMLWEDEEPPSKPVGEFVSMLTVASSDELVSKIGSE